MEKLDHEQKQHPKPSSFAEALIYPIAIKQNYIDALFFMGVSLITIVILIVLEQFIDKNSLLKGFFALIYMISICFFGIGYLTRIIHEENHRADILSDIIIGYPFTSFQVLGAE